MGIEDLGLLLENIEEYVMEQKKVVTYKWLSRTFSINVNQAKQLLAIFHMKHKNMKHKSIQGTYYVSGMRTNSQGQLTHQICIVTEDMLEATKAQLDPVTGVHLFSVQKGKPKETAPMYNVDFEQLKKKVYETTEFSMIQCKEAKISQVINNSLRPVTPPALKNKVKVMAPTAKSDAKPVELKKPTAAKKSVPVKKAVDNKKKQGDLANFFGKGKAEPKKAEPKKVEPKKAEPKKVEPKKPEPKKTAKIEATIITETKEIVKKPGRGTKRSPTKCTRQPLFVEVEEEEEVKEVEVKPKTKQSNGKSSCVGTKRKRVMQFSDDEEGADTVVTMTPDDEEKIPYEEMCVGDEERDQPQAQMEDESPEPKKARVGRKRVKKLVSKTSVNEDGFMETEKVWETESCTDDDEAEVPQVTRESKQKKAEVPTTNVAQTRNKQSNLMGFFKKS